MDYLRIISGLSLRIISVSNNIRLSFRAFMAFVHACRHFSWVTQNTAAGLRSFFHLITIEWLLGNSLKIKLCRWCPGALGSRTSTDIWRLNLQFQIAKAILFLFKQWISKFKCFTLYDTVITYFIKCLVTISTWPEPQNKVLVRAKPSATPVIGGHMVSQYTRPRCQMPNLDFA